MTVVRRLAVIAVLGVAVATILVTWALQVSAPQPEIRFFTLQESYRLGEIVSFRVENQMPAAFCLGSFHPWTVERLIDDEWRRVETHGGFNAVVRLEQGESREWGWFARSDPDRELYGFPEVLPGDYRIRLGGWPCESLGDSLTSMVLIAHFNLTA